MAVASFLVIGGLLLYRVKTRPKFCQVLFANDQYCKVQFGSYVMAFDLRLPAEDIEPIFSGAAWAGTVVWPTSVYLSNYLHRAIEKEQLAGVLELGAGIGVPSIAAYFLGAQHVIITEQPPLDGLIKSNVSRLPSSHSNVTVKNFDWFNGIPQDLKKISVSLVLVSDCIYEGLYGQSWKQLAKVIHELLTINRTCIALNCVERRKEDGIDDFNHLCTREYGLVVNLIEHEKNAEKRIIELYEIKL